MVIKAALTALVSCFVMAALGGDGILVQVIAGSISHLHMSIHARTSYYPT